MEKQNQPATADVQYEQKLFDREFEQIEFFDRESLRDRLLLQTRSYGTLLPEVIHFLNESEFSREQGAGKIETLLQLLQDIKKGSLLIDGIFSRMASALRNQARQLGLHGFTQASLATCRLQNEICQALEETGCSACNAEVSVILTRLVSFSDAFLEDNTPSSTATITTRSLLGDIRPILLQLFAGRNHSRSTNSTPRPTDINDSPTTRKGPLSNGHVSFNSFSCPSPLIKSTECHRLPALTVTMSNLKSAFIYAVSEGASQRHHQNLQLLLSCGLPCDQLPQLHSKALHRSVLLTLHGLSVASLTYSLATIVIPSPNRQKIASQKSLSLRSLIYFNIVGGVLSFGALTCGTNRGWCNNDNTLIQSIPSSASSTEFMAMALIYTWSMPALTITMTWMCIVWCLTTRSVRIVSMDNRTVSRQQTPDSNLCLLTLETGLVAVIAIATYFLFSAHKASIKETSLVDGWPHLGTCTFLAPLSDSPFLALFFTLFATSIVTAVGGVYYKFIHKTEALAYLRKHKMKLSQ